MLFVTLGQSLYQPTLPTIPHFLDFYLARNRWQRRQLAAFAEQLNHQITIIAQTLLHFQQALLEVKQLIEDCDRTDATLTNQPCQFNQQQ